jgi:hypothetical protein
VAGGFDKAAYLRSYSDLAWLGPDGTRVHWLQHGADEGRVGDVIFGREQTSHDLVGSAATSSISFANDHDWLILSLNAGQGIDGSLYGSSTGWGTLTDGGVRVYDANGFLLGADDGGGPGSNATVQVTAGTTGIYYVAALGTGPSAMGISTRGLSGVPGGAPLLSGDVPIASFEDLVAPHEPRNFAVHYLRVGEFGLLV